MFTINLKGTNLDLTPDIKSYLEKRLASLEKFLDEDDTTVVCDVELERSTKHKTGDVFRGEVTIRTRSGLYRAEANGETAEAAIDTVKDEVMRELRREKRKRIHLFRRGGARLKEFTHDLSARGIQVKDFVIRRRKK
jgi:putative sigma-54 modulation protein